MGASGQNPAGPSNDLIATLGAVRRSFAQAWAGLVHVYKTQRNMRLHVLFASSVGALCLVLGVDRFELLMVTLAIAAVLVAEVVNTVTESLTDLMEPDLSNVAKTTKDVAAGGVLVASAFAVLIGLIAFYPAVFDLASRLRSFWSDRLGYFVVYSVLVVAPALAGLALGARKTARGRR